MKYNDNGEIKELFVKAITVPKNEYNDSDSETYSCDYINSKTDWKYLGTATGQRAGNLILPKGWEEAMIYLILPASEPEILSVKILSGLKPFLTYTGDYNEVYFGCSAYAVTGSTSGSTVRGGNIALTQNDQVFLNYVPGYTGSTKMYVFYR